MKGVFFKPHLLNLEIQSLLIESKSGEEMKCCKLPWLQLFPLLLCSFGLQSREDENALEIKLAKMILILENLRPVITIVYLVDCCLR